MYSETPIDRTLINNLNYIQYEFLMAGLRN